MRNIGRSRIDNFRYHDSDIKRNKTIQSPVPKIRIKSYSLYCEAGRCPYNEVTPLCIEDTQLSLNLVEIIVVLLQVDMSIITVVQTEEVWLGASLFYRAVSGRVWTLDFHNPCD